MERKETLKLSLFIVLTVCSVIFVGSQEICDTETCATNQVCVREFMGRFLCKDLATQSARCSRIGFAGFYWRFAPCEEGFECRHLRCRQPRNRTSTATGPTTTSSPFTSISNSSEMRGK